MSIIPDVCAPALASAECPAWCALPAGHDAHRDEDGTVYRVHRAPVLADAGGRALDLVQHTALTIAGEHLVDAPRVVVDGDPDLDSALTVEQARHLSAALALSVEVLAGSAR